MKNRTFIRPTLTCILALITLVCVSVASENPSLNFKVKVVDDIGRPIPNAEVFGKTFLRWEPGQGFGKDIHTIVSQRTDKNGIAGFEIPSQRGDLSFSVVTPESYYSHGVAKEFLAKKTRAGKWLLPESEFEVKLQRKINPIPLYALQNKFLALPNIGSSYGYDMMAGDWTKPIGKGQTSDLLIKITSGDGESEPLFSIEFSNQGDGFYIFEGDLGELKVPHSAPIEGYQTRAIELAISSPENFSKKHSYFLRLRTVLNIDGSVKSAHYAKIHGYLNALKNGEFQLTYAFNPTPNDRNLELDTSRNLLEDCYVTKP